MVEKIINRNDVSPCCIATVEQIRSGATNRPAIGNEIACDGCEQVMVWKDGWWVENLGRATKSFLCDQSGDYGDPCWIQRGQNYVRTTWGMNPPPYRYCLRHYDELTKL